MPSLFVVDHEQIDIVATQPDNIDQSLPLVPLVPVNNDWLVDDHAPKRSFRRFDRTTENTFAFLRGRDVLATRYLQLDVAHPCLGFGQSIEYSGSWRIAAPGGFGPDRWTCDRSLHIRGSMQCGAASHRS